MAQGDETRRRVVVVGGGIMGAAIAWTLATRGVGVTLLERHQPDHDRGSSHGDGRIVRLTYGDAGYVALAVEALERWRMVERAAGARLIEPCGNLDLEPGGGAEIARIADQLERQGIAHDRLSADDIRARFPQITVPDDYCGLFQGDGGVIRADRALSVLWRMAAAAGADLQTGAAVERVEADDRQVDLVLEGGRRLRAGQVVLAAGAWTRGLAVQVGLDVPLAVGREQYGHHAYDAAGPSHGCAAMPSVIDYGETPNLYLLPEITVPGVKCGRHRAGPVVSPDAPRAFDEANRQAVGRWIEERFPCVERAPHREQTCFYTNTPDFDFVLDRHPRLPRVLVAGGFSGHGFKLAPRIGELIAGLLADPSMPAPEAFRIARFAAAG